MLQQIHEWKTSGEKIVFTNGVFDILHVGHVSYLKSAAELGTKLVVGLNSDNSVRTLNKGPERPINPEWARKTVLESLKFVDAAIIFNENTPLELIKEIKPHIIVKGGDYNPKESDVNSKTYIVGSKECMEWGGVVVSIPLIEGFSTTSIVEKLK
jgi:D-glycero-beta-D-manno-heptose 1-phosphate adenylyltransferase